MANDLPSIALVDDDPAVLRALSRLLRSHTFLVRTYESGQEFLASLPGGLPDCLIVDLQMPTMSGYELQQHLVRSSFNIPTIMITANRQAGLHQENPGLVAFLLKPLQESTLLAAINRAIDVSRECR